jgi:Meiotically up-regulated gene 113
MVQKDYILAEIARTARENGGEPLGVKRFYNETGIKQTDWAGRYWVRWSDAIIEAGFPANQLQAAFSDDCMLEKVASLVRRLGHFPVKNELLMHRRTDDALPHHATLARRFGSRRQLAERVLEYCKNAGGCEDIIAICRRLCDGSPKIPLSLGRASLNTFGDVYLLKCGRSYKTGHSNASGRRERELAIQLPEKSKIVHVIKTDDPCGIERYWHQRFDSKRKNGEWFELSAEDVAAFRRRKFM